MVGVIKLSVRRTVEKGGITTTDCSEDCNIPGYNKANYCEHNTEFNGALTEWMAYPDSLSAGTDVPKSL